MTNFFLRNYLLFNVTTYFMKVFEFMTYFWRQDVTMISWCKFDVMTYFLMSWCIFGSSRISNLIVPARTFLHCTWFHITISIVHITYQQLTNWQVNNWQVDSWQVDILIFFNAKRFDLMVYFWCHDVSFLHHDILFDVIIYFFRHDEVFDVMTYFLFYEVLFDAMTDGPLTSVSYFDLMTYS